ncbi:Rid family detoxifying hydrolase [uncultured Dokdonia sp.]|uniref:RidA family protein n=1 Tax=uncultured Dokdonia sp. TaxID=575653 RepID=UPI00261A2025|nr:Rid family detoxifying hydrolase [uncultured Dokdonia sp.]
MKTPLLTIVLFAILLCSCETKPTKPVVSEVENIETTTPIEVTYHASHEPKKATAPFSDAVQVGDLFFLSGQIGMDQTTRTLVEGGIEAETKQTLENIKAVLAHHGMDMSDVVKSLVVLDNIEDFAAFNAIYTTYLPQKPARTTFAAEALAAGAKIEIEVIAVKR